MKVLVTGGLGFIGSNLVKSLSDLGYIVTVVDDLSSARKDYELIINEKNSVEYVLDSFSSIEILKRIKEKEFDTVFHVAAIPRVSYSVEEPFKTTEVNVSETVKLLESCRGNVKRFIFSSSSSVYGGADTLPTSTSHPKNPKSPYAWQKSCIEDIIRIFCDLYDFDALCLRYFNVFGPGQFGGSAYSTAVSAWCHAIKHNKTLRKDGTGEQSRDMCYIDNVVQANILAMNCEKNFSGDVFNVACNDRTSNNEILDFLEKKFGKQKIQQAPFRQGDVMHSQADISDTIKALGYEPKVRFWKGLQKTLEWWEM
tara:strand:+ start:1803 stop:2735 length:933 start_codon:yes stop_codon:yes gene_type:complete